jgi:hypothetical protein
MGRQGQAGAGRGRGRSAGLAGPAARFPCRLRSVGWLAVVSAWLARLTSFPACSDRSANLAGRLPSIVRWPCWLGWLGSTVSLHSPLGRLAWRAWLDGFPAFSARSAGFAGRLPCIISSVGLLGWLCRTVSLHSPLGRLAWLAQPDGFPAFSARSAGLTGRLPSMLARLACFRVFSDVGWLCAFSAGLAGRCPCILRLVGGHKPWFRSGPWLCTHAFFSRWWFSCVRPFWSMP